MDLSCVHRPPVEPIASLGSWSTQLQRIASAPLRSCPHFPRIAQRFEAWWRQELYDRPIFLGAVGSNPARPITRRLELLDQPQQWLTQKKIDLAQTHWVGDSVPNIRVDFGAVLLGALLGGRTTIEADTTWTHAYINDEWSNAPDWRLQREHPWWGLLSQLLALTAADARGDYLVCTPDLGGSADVLLNLRGSGELCLDALERPDTIGQAIHAIYPAWREVFQTLYSQTVEQGAGVFHWLRLWSNQPYMVPACDFNYMIGPREFQQICLSDIDRQAATVGRAVYHLDGPGAARHIDALLELPSIQAIQFTPGEGAPSALAWVEMFRKIQQRGRSVLVICPHEEVVELCRQLDPRGLALLVSGPGTPAELDRLFEEFCRPYGGDRR